MDDATRAELAELRRRAYGPTPDIADDAVAMSRLAALESVVLSEHAAHYAAQHPSSLRGADDADFPGEDDADAGDPEPYGAVWRHHIDDAGAEGAESKMPLPGAVATLEAAPRAEEPGLEPRGPRLPRLRRRHDGSGLALTAALVAVAVGAISAIGPPPASKARVTIETTREAYTLTRDRDAVLLLNVPLDGWFGVDVDLPAEEIPDFPTSGTMDWASPLGEYYGWDLWIGGASGAIQEEQCILLVRGAEAKGRCVVAALRNQSALVASLPYPVIAADERPDGFRPGMRIGFWWGPDPVIRVLMAGVPELR